MDTKKLESIGFYIFFGLVGLVVALMWWPFWQILALAAIISVLFTPVYERINREFNRPNLSATLSIILVLLIIILPLWLFGQLLFNQLVEVYNNFRIGQLSFSQAALFNKLSPEWQALLGSISNDTAAIFSKFTASTFTFVQQLLSNLASFFISMFLLVFLTFFMLRDGSKIKSALADLSFLPENYERELITKVEGAISGVLKGTFLVALVQGAVGVLGFWLFGLPQPLLWGAATIISSMVPNVGTAIIMIPAVIFLFFTGHTPQAVGLAVWGALAVGLVDNMISPKLIGKSLKMHPVLALLSIVGGLQIFGFLGFLFGPIIMAVFLALVEIYRVDLKGKAEVK